MIMPTTRVKRKNRKMNIMVSNTPVPPLLPLWLTESMTERMMMPTMSSMRAAPRMVAPTWVLSLPISVRVSTVMLTEVAANTVPT